MNRTITMDDFVTPTHSGALGWIVISGQTVGWWELNLEQAEVECTFFEEVPQDLLGLLRQEAQEAASRAAARFLGE
jgi:hypothetical protein